MIVRLSNSVPRRSRGSAGMPHRPVGEEVLEVANPHEQLTGAVGGQK